MAGLTRIQLLEKQNKDLRTRLENSKGKAELRDKDIVITMLQKEIGVLMRKLDEAQCLRDETMRRCMDAAVEEATAPLLCELAKAQEEIARLKAIIGKDSGNSSKPPSADRFKKPLQNSREKSSLSRGGQTGHTGHRLALPENLDGLVEKGAVKKLVIDHTGGSGEYVSRYVIDVEVVTTVTEHRYAKGAKLPAHLYNEVSYGDNIKAMSVLLLTEGIIAEKRFSEILRWLTQGAVAISPATLEKFQSQFARRLESSGELEAIKEDLLNGGLMHTDDTSMRAAETIEYLQNGEATTRVVDGKSSKATIRTHSNETSTFYTVNPKKDKEGVERDDLLGRFFGILCHDHEAKFYRYGTWHATCGEHLLRDLKGLRDLAGIPWAGQMSEHMAKMNRHKNKDVKECRTSCCKELLAGFEEEYDNLIERGWVELEQMRGCGWRHNDFKAMLNRLTNYKDCYLLFMRNYKAPFTNNLAERDLRPEKTKEKVSLLFRSWSGVVNHVKIRSFISTIKKREQDLYSAIVMVNRGIPVLR